MALATSLSLLLSNSVMAHDNSNGLRLVMQGLLDDSLVLNQGILEKDFLKIGKASNDIANHPKPGMTTMKKVIMGLGSEMRNFKSFDTLVHDIAMNIKEAAAKEDMVTVKSSYQELLNGCLSCHTQYKARVAKLLK